MELYRKKFRLANPLRLDQSLSQEVVIGTTPFYDYSDSPWVAIDTEFLSLKLPYDQLCTIQIASPHPEDPQLQRVEVIWVWQRDNSAEDTIETQEKIAALLGRKDLEIIMHVSSADLSRLEKFANTELRGKVFDTKVGARIALTNTDRHGMDDLITNLIDPRFTKDRRVTSAQWDAHPKYWEDKMIEYAMNDVIFLRALELRLTEIAERRGHGDLLQRTMATLPTVSALYRHGLDEHILGY